MVDFMATFAEDAEWSLFDEVSTEDELASIVGPPVDFVSRRAIERSPNWIRRRGILEGAKPIHGA